METIKIIKQKGISPDYNPKIAYILANKKPNSRMYGYSGQGKNAIYRNP